jgi:hypothetical protein
MKPGRLIHLILLFPMLVIWGCQGDDGPVGPAGEDGADGVDGNVTCLDCHNTATQQDITLQYARSQHALGEYVDYAGGRSSCARCHSGGGFVEFVMTGDVDGNINVPVAIGCSHCHNVHTTFESADYALRTTAPVALIADETHLVDFGNSNLCANCHQSRRPEPNIAEPGETFEITSTHYGPHHAAHANILDGFGFAEIEGSVAYPTTSLHLTAGATCVTCHMGEYTDGEGGHTWNPSLAACNDCHSTTDFNYGGVQAEIQAKLDELRDLLVEAGVVEYVEEDEAYEPIVGTYPMIQARAFFNWVGISEDRSLGVHNPRYVDALLSNSIEALTP